MWLTSIHVVIYIPLDFWVLIVLVGIDCLIQCILSKETRAKIDVWLFIACWIDGIGSDASAAIVLGIITADL